MCAVVIFSTLPKLPNRFFYAKKPPNLSSFYTRCTDCQKKMCSVFTTCKFSPVVLTGEAAYHSTSCTSSPALIPHARLRALQLSQSHRTVKVCSSEQTAVSVVIQILRLMNHTVSCPKVFNNYESLLVVFKKLIQDWIFLKCFLYCLSYILIAVENQTQLHSSQLYSQFLTGNNPNYTVQAKTNIKTVLCTREQALDICSHFFPFQNSCSTRLPLVFLCTSGSSNMKAK